jgi:hypothetical protein
MVIGVLDPRRHEAHAEQNILARLQSAGSDDDCILRGCRQSGVPPSLHWRGASMAAPPRFPRKRRRPGRRPGGRRAPQPGLPADGRRRASGSQSSRQVPTRRGSRPQSSGQRRARQPHGTIPALRWRRALRRAGAASRENDGSSSSRRGSGKGRKPISPCYPGWPHRTSLPGRLSRTDSPRCPACAGPRNRGAGQRDRLLRPWGGRIGGDLG